MIQILDSRYTQTFIDHAKKTTADALKTAKNSRSNWWFGR